MKSLAPALGPGLGVGAAGEESRRGGEKGEGRADVPPLDDVVGYAPALLLSEGSQDDSLAQRCAELGVAVTTAEEEGQPGVAEALAAVGGEACRAVLVRPDRYVLGAAESTAELESLLAAAVPWPRAG